VCRASHVVRKIPLNSEPGILRATCDGRRVTEFNPFILVSGWGKHSYKSIKGKKSALSGRNTQRVERENVGK
jgi:hypothetical protein